MRGERFRRETNEALRAGWEIEEESPERVVLVRRDFGDLLDHVFIAVLTTWWSFGVTNAAYAAYKYFDDAERRVLWEERRPCPACGERTAEYCRHCGEDLPRNADGTLACTECKRALG